MTLTLTVVSSQGAGMASSGRFIFGPEGGTIGRRSDNHWVLPDEQRFVSSQHARILFDGSSYFLEDISSNGTYVNDFQAPVGRGNRVALNEGDRIYIGDFEILVSVETVQASGADPFAPPVPPVRVPLPVSPGSPFQSPPSGTDDLLDPFGAAAEDSPDVLPQDELDPLLAFGAPGHASPGPSNSPGNTGGGAMPDHTPSQADYFAPPRASKSGIPENWDQTSLSKFDQPAPAVPPAPAAPVPPEAPASDGLLPENWDMTNFGTNEAAPTPTPAPPGGGAAGTLPDNWDEASFPPGPAPAIAPESGVAPPTPEGPRTDPFAPRQQAGPAGQPLDAAPQPSAGLSAPPATTPEVLPPDHPQPPVAPPVPPAPGIARPVTTQPTQPPAAPVPGGTVGAPPAAQPGPNDLIALRELLEGAGLSAADIPPGGAAEFMRATGEILRETVSGLRDVLAARAALKNEFRIAMTMIRPAQNNPLKFSLSVEDALSNLMLKRGTGFLTPIAAVREGFDDVKAHQMAIMAGMKEAFAAVMKRFDPQVMQENFDKTLKRGSLLSINSKAKYWDMFADTYDDLSGDPDEAFQRLFGEEFVRAYEAQMQAYENAKAAR